MQCNFIIDIFATLVKTEVKTLLYLGHGQYLEYLESVEGDNSEMFAQSGSNRSQKLRGQS